MGVLRGRRSDQNCAAIGEPRIALTFFREYKLFRVQRKLDPDEQMWLTLLFGSLLLAMMVWLMGQLR